MHKRQEEEMRAKVHGGQVAEARLLTGVYGWSKELKERFILICGNLQGNLAQPIS